MPLSLNRIFKNDREYKDYKSLKYVDSLAYTVQEILYTDEAYDDYFNYDLANRIQLCDVMTVAVYFISASANEFGKAAISRSLKNIETSFPFLSEKVEYTKDNHLLVSEASHELVLTILWIAYIYVKFLSELEGSKNEMWNNAESLLLSLMKKKSCLDSSAFEKLYLKEKITPAMQVFVKHWSKNYVNKTANQQEKFASKNELPKQNEDVQALQQQLEAAKQMIAELEQKVLDLKEQVDIFNDKEKGHATGLNQSESALFVLSLSKDLGFNFSNKKKAIAPIVHALFGWGQESVKRKLCEGFTKDVRERVSEIFKEVSPSFSETILKYEKKEK